ncbi:hypothetical protein [Cellulomonas sp.]
MSAWSSKGETWQLSCGAATRAQGTYWASMNTGGCRWTTYVRAQYVDYGTYYYTTWHGGDSTFGASYVEAFNTVKHQVSY